jgi:transcriptional regulator with XRE-family HTH domain
MTSSAASTPIPKKSNQTSMPPVNAAPGLPHRLAARRLQLGRTQAEVEAEAEIARTTLSRLERDDCPLVPRVSTIERLAKALRIEVTRLVNPDRDLDFFPVPVDRPKTAVFRNGAEHRRRRTPRRPATGAQ